jgi:hypothetical protein
MLETAVLRKMLALGALLLSLLVTLPACQASLGPNAIRRAVPSYNETLISEMNQQLLLNLVRLRYRDNPLFLEVGTITTQQTLATSGGVNVSGTAGGVNGAGAIITPSAGVSYSETPTIVFTPLQGESFFRRMMSPLPPVAVLLFASSGWSIARVMGLATDRINDLANAPSAAGPTPALAPPFADFRELLKTLRELQLKHALNIGLDVNGKETELAVEFSADPANLAELDKVRRLLHLAPNQPRYTFTSDMLARDEIHVAVRMRSLLSVLFYLSQAVEVPVGDANSGLVTRTLRADGQPFDWQQLFGGWFRVQASDREPPAAYVKARYRGHWFYVDDRDLESKSTFMLVTELFNLQAGQSAAPAPQLTLPLR